MSKKMADYSLHNKKFDRYNIARFIVQSVLLPDVSNQNQGEGQLHVTAQEGYNIFKVHGFKPTLVDIVYDNNGLHLQNSVENSPILEAVLSRITPNMYKRDVPSRDGKVPRHASNGKYRDWEGKFLERVKARGEYLTLYAILSINPKEWGATPAKQTGDEITVGRTAGRNVTGHAVLPGGYHYNKI